MRLVTEFVATPTGFVPTGIVASTASLVVSITEISLEIVFDTNIVLAGAFTLISDCVDALTGTVTIIAVDCSSSIETGIFAVPARNNSDTTKSEARIVRCLIINLGF